MGASEGTSAQPRSKRKSKPRLRYFYIGQELHKVLRVNRPQNLVVAWNYTEHKRVVYIWSEVRRTMKKAYSLQDVAKMLNRHRVRLENHLLSGNVRLPQKIYSLDGNRTPGKFMFSEKDIYELHDYMLTVHRGRPRKDGGITAGNLPSRVELRAMLNTDTALYIRNESGEFVQVYKEKDW